LQNCQQLTEYTKIQYSQSQKIETPTENVYARYENPKPLCGKKGTYTPNLLKTAVVPPTLGAEVRENYKIKFCCMGEVLT